MDSLMNLLGTVPQGMEEIAFIVRCFIFILIISGVIDIIKGITFRLSKGGM
ncbi:hypothetical protein [Caloranaerobacter ferrireducens]|uniref:hypothetical protein n=1 Tax=Caloranaerobacter ferrireducens TaxID=1323370 RepID=UPI00159F274B|nr:hypothetical protein [Caloranaerobacter ferrireducens]